MCSRIFAAFLHFSSPDILVYIVGLCNHDPDGLIFRFLFTYLIYYIYVYYMIVFWPCACLNHRDSLTIGNHPFQPARKQDCGVVRWSSMIFGIGSFSKVPLEGLMGRFPCCRIGPAPVSLTMYWVVVSFAVFGSQNELEWCSTLGEDTYYQKTLRKEPPEIRDVNKFPKITEMNFSKISDYK